MIQGRQGALERAQPGAGEVLLAFCDQRGAAAFRLPWFARWAPLVQPLLAEARACPSVSPEQNLGCRVLALGPACPGTRAGRRWPCARLAFRVTQHLGLELIQGVGYWG